MLPKINNKTPKANHNDKHQQQQQQKQHRTTLPTEIINEILLKLPTESILRCTSVCKSWYSLITDPHFTKSHLNLSVHPTLIFKASFGKPDLNTCCLSDVMDGNFVNAALEVVDYPLRIDGKHVSFVGSCNGLLCMHIVGPGLDDNLFIWNPTTRKYNRLPSIGYCTYVSPVHFSFGYDTSSDDYKVVSVFKKHIQGYECERFVKMYSLRDGTWKDISVFFIQSEPSDGIIKLLNGALHWMVVDGDRRLTINSLDLATETYGEVSQPLYDKGKKELLLGTLGDSLCVMCTYRGVCVDLWVMKDYGVRHSWSKVVSVSYVVPLNNHHFEPVCISNDGKVLFILGKKLMIYNSSNSSFSDVTDFKEYFEASTFVESLVSPMPPAAATLGHRVASSNE